MIGFAAAVSGSYPMGAFAGPHIDPAAFSVARLILAALAMGALAWAGPGLRGGHLTRAPWRYLALGGLMGLFFVLMFEALRITDPVSTGAVFTLTPVFAASFGWLLLRQRTSAFNAAALALGAAGALWVIFDADVGAMLGFEMGPGERLFLVGVIGHALYTPLVRVLNRGEPVIVFAFGTVLGALVMVSLWAGAELTRVDWAALPAIVWVAVAYTAIFATAGSFMMLQFAALRLPAGKVMAYTYLTPAFVILWEGALGHGWPAAPIWFGAAASAAALALLAWR